jgi:integrase
VTKRRTKGDGGLTQRHDHPSCPEKDEDGTRPEHRCRGRWQGTLDVIIDGRRRRKYVYGRTQQEAKAKLTKAIRERDQGQLVMRTLTVERWMTEWLERKGKPPKALKPQTLRSYQSKVRLYILPQLGRHRLTALRGEHIETMYDVMRRDGLAEATLRQTHAILKKALSDAIRRDLLVANPVDKVDPPGTEKNVRHGLTVTEARTVLRAAGDDARWWLALFYGMRQGEALGLRWCDIDFERHTLTIEQTLQTDEDYRIIFDRPKSAASARSLPLVPLMEARLKLRLAVVGDHAPTDLVFTHNQHPIWPNKDWEAWRDLLATAGVPHVALHAARNSAASLLEAAGVPDRVVAQILGHSTVQITHGYQSADDDRLRQAFDAAGRLLELE